MEFPEGVVLDKISGLMRIIDQIKKLVWIVGMIDQFVVVVLEQSLLVSIVEKLWLLAGNLATAMFPRVASSKLRGTTL